MDWKWQAPNIRQGGVVHYTIACNGPVLGDLIRFVWCSKAGRKPVEKFRNLSFANRWKKQTTDPVSCLECIAMGQPPQKE